MSAIKIPVPHITVAEGDAILLQLKGAKTALLAKTINLTPEQRQENGSINEQRKLLIKKVEDYRSMSPELSSPDVDWSEFGKTNISRSVLEKIMLMAMDIIELAGEPKIAHDSNSVKDALEDYRSTRFQADGKGGGYETKKNEIAQFFTEG